MYADTLDTDILTYLKRHEAKELLRFVTVGSVDDGKSTLIGRLLFDTHGVYDDQLADARVQGGAPGEIDLARITDGLQAEREQGITIDVAYRYFTTPKRKFIIADTPGHVQYTRNMATGASTANVAIILIDARLGVLPQSRRHAFIASLLGIPHLLVAINKMDLVDFSQDRFEELKTEFTKFCSNLHFRDVTFIPISALLGDNVVRESTNTGWYGSHTILSFLENVDIVGDVNLQDFRLPVQYVLRPNLDYRGFSGQIASGEVRPGDSITVLPSGKSSVVTSIDTYDGPIPHAFAPMSITLRLRDEIDISRGDVIVGVGSAAAVGRAFESHIVWMNESPLDPSRSYLIKHATHYVRAEFPEIVWKVDLETLEKRPAPRLELNEIGLARVQTHRPIPFDLYSRNRGMGAFIVIDPMTNTTVGAGMIAALNDDQEAIDESADDAHVRSSERARRFGNRGAAIFVSGHGADDLAIAIERWLFDHGHFVARISASFAGTLAAAAGDTGLLLIVSLPSPGSPTVEIAAPSQEHAHAPVGAENSASVNAQAVAATLRSRGILLR